MGRATALERGPGEPVEADPNRRRPRTFSEPKLSTGRRITSSRRRHSGSRSPRARPRELGRKMGIEPMSSRSHPDVLTVELHPPWAHPVDDVGRDLRRPRVAAVVERGGFEPPKVFQLIYSQTSPFVRIGAPDRGLFAPGLRCFSLGHLWCACVGAPCLGANRSRFGAPMLRLVRSPLGPLDPSLP